MAFLLTAAAKDLRRRLADPTAFLLWIGLPIAIGGLMSLISGGSGGPAPTAHLLLVDQDNTMASRLLAGAGSQGPAGSFLQVEQVSAEDGAKRIQAGEASALLTIPKGFQDGVLNEKPTVLTLVTNPSQRILPGIIEEGLRMVAEASFYLQRFLGEPIRRVLAERGASAESPPSDDTVAAVSRVVNQDLTRLRTLLSPVISLETKTEDEPTDTFDFTAIFLPGLLFMGVLFTASGMSLDVWVEKELGTLRRSLGAPHGRAVFLAGKLLAAVALMAVVAVVVLVLSAFVSTVPLRRVPMAAAWACYAGGALFCYFFLLQLLASSARGGGLLSQLIVFPLMMIGGSFFPFEAMPSWMIAIGRWTPNGLAVVREKDLLFGHPDLGAMAVAAVAIGAPAALAFLLGVRRLGRFATS
jgi:ABC-type Na+ efflux pump permease subunit